ncbi:cyclodeaminase/cyclohydrolase family protein [Clostridium thailandense]|uniref:cyclodeaminase/cyclohydrolase family protein n=1 Tax=Clostridium thailandense TaxID=2794346 RepID=UPI00398A2957
MLSDKSINSFLENIASKPLTPAAGSIAALSAASAAALTEMAANLTSRKDEYQDISDKMKEIAEECSSYREIFLNDIDKDTKAFKKVIDSYLMKADTEAQKEIKQKELQDNFRTAIEIPLSMADNIVELIYIIKFVDKHGCSTSASDVKQAYILAESSVRSSIFLIKSNLVFIHDQEFQSYISKKIDELEAGLEI